MNTRSPSRPSSMYSNFSFGEIYRRIYGRKCCFRATPDVWCRVDRWMILVVIGVVRVWFTPSFCWGSGVWAPDELENWIIFVNKSRAVSFLVVVTMGGVSFETTSLMFVPGVLDENGVVGLTSPIVGATLVPVLLCTVDGIKSKSYLA